MGTREAILKTAQHSTVTLIYSSHDAEHNNAVGLKDYWEAKMQKDAHQRSAPVRGSAG